MQTLTNRLAKNEYCLYKDKSTCSKSHLFVLGKAVGTHKNTVSKKVEHSQSYYTEKAKFKEQNSFIPFCALSAAKGMDIKMITDVFNNIFEFISETNITEEYFYSNKGIYPVYSGQTEDDGVVAYIDTYKQDGEYLTFTTYGVNAGTLNFRNGKFTVGRNCLGLILKNEYKDLISLEWFSFKYQNLFYKHRIGDVSGQRSLNKTLLEKVILLIPDIKIQTKQLNQHKKIKTKLNYIEKLVRKCKDLLICKLEINNFIKEDIIKNIFTIHGGNGGLTEEFIYENQPISIFESVEIYSSANIKSEGMGYISKYAKYKEKNIKTFSEPCILVARNGYAGTMTFIENKEFAINDHAYILVLKKKWQKIINLRWFVFQYQELFYNLTTSKSDNATFNKTYAEMQNIKIPDIILQNTISIKLLKIDNILNKMENVKDKLQLLLSYDIV